MARTGQDRLDSAAQADDVSGRDQVMEAVETPWKGAPQYLQEQEITADDSKLKLLDGQG